jgi:hypothetical protein
MSVGELKKKRRAETMNTYRVDTDYVARQMERYLHFTQAAEAASSDMQSDYYKRQLIRREFYGGRVSTLCDAFDVTFDRLLQDLGAGEADDETVKLARHVLG